MSDLILPFPGNYQADTQARIAYTASMLDDQLRRLKRSVAGLDVEALEWQPETGRNTVGMLLAHLAIAEVWWMKAGAEGISDPAEVNPIVKGIIGINPQDDGIPIAEGGRHPEVLRGTTLDEYLQMIDAARATTHDVLHQWIDRALESTVIVRDRRVSRGWMLYHLFEHFTAHYGQILLLLRVMRERGLVPAAPQQ